MSKGTRKVINCSKSGAKISTTSEIVDEFFSSGIDVCAVDKIILCIGINDIKFFRGNVRYRFYNPINELIIKIKSHFP